MPKRIRTINELPSWFDISKYSAVSGLSDLELADELDSRAVVYNAGPRSKELLFSSITSQYPLVTQHPFYENLLEYDPAWKVWFNGRPVECEESQRLKNWDGNAVVSDDDRLAKEVGGWGEQSLLAEIKSKMIQPLRYIDIANRASQSPLIPKLEKKDSIAIIRFDDIPGTEDNDHCAFLKVDLKASNSELENSFKQVLAIYRVQKGVKEPAKKVTDTNIRKIKDYGVVPYIDLKLWADLNGVEVAPSVYANVLYPDGRYGEKLINESVKTLAEMALEQQFINSVRERGFIAEQNQRKKNDKNKA